MHANAALIQRFYSAFDAKDAAVMGACYAEDATFSDPAFPDLDAGGVRAMWAMLTGRAPDLRVTATDIQANDTEGSCTWVATYTFSQTKRKVENRIRARFRFRDGRIIRHDDEFDFWRWSWQALGPVGLLLGWTAFLQKKVQATAAEGLRRYRSSSVKG